MMTFVKVSMYTFFISCVVFSIVSADYFNLYNKRVNINAQKFVGKWYLIAVISDVKISDIPKCIVWNVEKEQNNIFNIRINEGMPSDEVRNLKRRFSNFPSGYLDLIDERSGSGEYVDYLNNFEAVLRRKDKVGYFLLSRTPKGVFKKLYHEYDIGAQENNWIYTTIDQVNCIN